MVNKQQKLSAPLVSVSVVFSREELSGLDFMATSLGLDRGRVVRAALDVLAAAGPDALHLLEGLQPGQSLSAVRCGFCGAS